MCFLRASFCCIINESYCTSKPYTTTIEYTEKSVTRDALATNEVPEVIKLKKGDEKM